MKQRKHLEKNAKFSATLAYDAIRGNKEEVKWWRLAWYKIYILKHALLVWILFHGQLSTRGRLFIWELQY